ncbi:hypothetical protein PR048_002301 [Dryococelus australis]|uniref:Uncharacterized protein n=1 Tax=Dryococelus australis TaxID=614101 RepID=A0ABQ9IJU4_9NEOP|nr:hypothetical protein PR048_002301 [Dryococelus australis]
MLVWIHLTEGHIKNALGITQAITLDPNKQWLFLAAVCDLPQVRDKFEADFVAVETAVGKKENLDTVRRPECFTSFDENNFEIMAVVDCFDELNICAVSADSQPFLKLFPNFESNPHEWSNFPTLFITLVAHNPKLSAVKRLSYLIMPNTGDHLGMV